MAKKVRAAHILVKTEQEANIVIYDLDHGMFFEEIAKARSLCPSKKKGGNLGWFSNGQMVKEFEKATFKLKKGEISNPIKTQFGWHIIKLNDKKG